jgi:hypothetical protein
MAEATYGEYIGDVAEAEEWREEVKKSMSYI